MKIIHKISLGFLAIVLLIWVVGYFAAYAGQSALEKAIGESSISLSKGILSEIDKDIHSRIVTFQAYSKNHLLQKALKESNRKFENMKNVQEFIDTNDQKWTSAEKQKITPFMAQSIQNELSDEYQAWHFK